jgi:hypothetical protein
LFAFGWHLATPDDIPARLRIGRPVYPMVRDAATCMNEAIGRSFPHSSVMDNRGDTSMRGKMFFLVLSLSATTSAFAAQNGYLSVPSVHGGSQSKASQSSKLIEQSSFHFGAAASTPSTPPAHAGKVTLDQLSPNAADRPVAVNSKSLPKVNPCALPNPPRTCARPNPKH